jgi:hypothetical protein
MSKPVALIQIISEQTLQNLLPVVALQPERLVHLSTSRMDPRSDWVMRAAKAMGHQPRVAGVALSDQPDIPELEQVTGEQVERLRAEGLEVVVNFTGGTKLMSIGAHLAAGRAHCRSLYVDTENQRFVDGGTGEPIQEILSGCDRSFTTAQQPLRADILALANGVERITAGNDWRPYVDLARDLCANPELEEACHAAFQGPQGLFPRGGTPRDHRGWLAILDRPVALPEPLRAGAVAAGLLRAEGDAVLLPDGSRPALEALGDTYNAGRYFRAIEPLVFTQNFFSGAWWEVAVVQAMERQGVFRDLHWSVEAGSRGGDTLEEDVLAVDGTNLVLVSCKRGGRGAGLLSHLEELDARAGHLGGRYCRRFLAVYRPLRDRVGKNLASRARRLNIGLLRPGNLDDAQAWLAY